MNDDHCIIYIYFEVPNNINSKATVLVLGPNRVRHSSPSTKSPTKKVRHAVARVQYDTNPVARAIHLFATLLQQDFDGQHPLYLFPHYVQPGATEHNRVSMIINCKPAIVKLLSQTVEITQLVQRLKTDNNVEIIISACEGLKIPEGNPVIDLGAY